MKPSRRKSPSRRTGQDTSTRTREVAEQLFADFGAEAVSLRQIAAAASAGNNNTVQYYFGDKEGLVRSIFERRLPALDASRAAMFAKLSASEVDDPARLLEILLRPLAEAVDEKGRHRWAAFLLAIDNAPAMMAIRIEAESQAPVTAMIAERLINALEPWPAQLALHRLRVAYRTFFRGLVATDRAYGEESAKTRSALIEDYLTIAKLILSAPAAPAIVAAMSTD